MGINQKWLQLECAEAYGQLEKLSRDASKLASARVGPAQAGAAGGGDDFRLNWAQRVARGAGALMFAGTVGEAMSGIADALRGDWGKLSDDIGKIPLFGGAAISLRDGFDDLVLGIRAGIQRMKEELAERGAWLKAVGGMIGVQKAWAFKLELVGAEGFRHELIGVRQEAEKAHAEISAKANEPGGLGETHASVIGAHAAVSKWAEAQGADIAGRERGDALKAQADGLKTYAGALRQVRDEFAKLTMSEEDYLAWQVGMMPMGPEEQRDVLAERLKNLRVAKEKKAADDALRGQQELLDEARRGDEERLKNIEDVRRSAETPTEEFGRGKEDLDRLLAQGLDQPTYTRRVRKLLEQAAAGLPDIAASVFGHRGTFSGFEAGLGMGGMGAGEVLARKTADNTEKMARLLQRLADEGTPLVYGS